ncbi:ABC transporter permease [Lachnospiraceae bacterium 62-35]
MIGYIGKRLLTAAASLAAVIFILFLLMELLPGSPFNDEKLTTEQIEILNAAYGLDKPFWVRFFVYASHMVRGDFGVSYSIAKNVPVTLLLSERLPVSLRTGGLAVLFGGSAGIILGVAAEVKNSRRMEAVFTIFTMLGVSLPSYVLALILSYLLGFRLGWFPLLYQPEYCWYSSVLPAAALGMFMAASTAKVMKAGMAEAMESEYIMFAECRGVSGRRLLLYGLRNALLPTVSAITPMAAAVMTGSLAVERIFSIPGAGSLMTAAIQANDYNVAAGLSFSYSVIYIAVMLAADMLYQLLDPRIRLA